MTTPDSPNNQFQLVFGIELGSRKLSYVDYFHFGEWNRIPEKEDIRTTLFILSVLVKACQRYGTPSALNRKIPSRFNNNPLLQIMASDRRCGVFVKTLYNLYRERLRTKCSHEYIKEGFVIALKKVFYVVTGNKCRLEVPQQWPECFLQFRAVTQMPAMASEAQPQSLLGSDIPVYKLLSIAEDYGLQLDPNSRQYFYERWKGDIQTQIRKSQNVSKSKYDSAMEILCSKPALGPCDLKVIKILCKQKYMPKEDARYLARKLQANESEFRQEALAVRADYHYVTSQLYQIAGCYEEAIWELTWTWRWARPPGDNYGIRLSKKEIEIIFEKSGHASLPEYIKGPVLKEFDSTCFECNEIEDFLRVCDQAIEYLCLGLKTDTELTQKIKPDLELQIDLLYKIRALVIGKDDVAEGHRRVDELVEKFENNGNVNGLNLVLLAKVMLYVMGNDRNAALDHLLEHKDLINKGPTWNRFKLNLLYGCLLKCDEDAASKPLETAFSLVREHHCLLPAGLATIIKSDATFLEAFARKWGNLRQQGLCPFTAMERREFLNIAC